MDNNFDYPKVTICVPTFNRAKLLSDCLKSCLAQNYPNFEIVISNNASSDNTEEIVKGFDNNLINYYKQSTTIPALDNWNYCINKANGEYLTFVSDDDLLEPNYIEELIKLMRKYPNASLWKCRFRYIDIDNNNLGEQSPFPKFVSAIKFIECRIQYDTQLALPGFLCKTENMKNINGFIDVGFPGALYSDDYCWFRLSFLGDGVAFTNKILWNFRTHLTHMGAFIDIDIYNKKIPNYINLLMNLVSKSDNSSDILEYIKYQYPEKLITERIRIELGRQLKKSKIDYILKIPSYFKLIKKCNAKIKRREIFTSLL